MLKPEIIQAAPHRATRRALFILVVLSAFGFAVPEPVPAAAVPRPVVSGSAADIAHGQSVIEPAQYRRPPHRRGLVAWLGDLDAVSLTGSSGQASRVHSGRPRSSMRFRTFVAIATSVA
jgi:hypothetical protein